MNAADPPKRFWPAAFSWQEEGFLFSSLMLITCYFLPWQDDRTPAELLLDRSGWTLFTAVWWLLFVCMALTPWSVRLPRLRPWAGLVTANAVNTLVIMGANGYGAQLARFFAFGMLVLSAAPAAIIATDLAMKRLHAQKAEVFSHWGTALQGLQFSAQDFYARLEKEILARQWPGVELLRVPHSEAGLLSHRRDYLRVIRQRQVFDICAARFGQDYFFTLREAEIQPQLTVATLLIFLLTLWMIFSWTVGTLGLLAGGILFGILAVLGFFLMFNALRMGLTRLDGVLMRLPVIGAVYETWFRRSTTYFQHDTRVVFLKLMDDLVKQQVDEETSAKGVKLLSWFEHQPIFDGFYKVSAHETGKRSG